jgi:cytochrome b561
MTRLPQDQRYGSVARTFHWTIGVLVLVNLVLGLGHDVLKGFPVMPIHKAIGLTVLVLTLGRIAWRLAHRPPPLPAGTARWERPAALTVHWLLYALMIVMPVTGWIMSSAGPYPLSWFGLFDVPKFDVAKGSAFAEASHEGHELLGYLMLALALVHIAAALRHHFIRRDTILARMIG